ncbi:potassium-transporting ATPase subunit F [Denitrificimonas caeni]
MLVLIHWLCGISAAGLFGYLAYSLIRAESF